MELTFGRAETVDEIRAAQRVRYAVYVEELGRYRGRADEADGRLAEPEDETAWVFFVKDGDEVVATGRCNWGGHGFSDRQVEQYHLDYFLDEIPAELLAVGERYAILPQYRGSQVLQGMGAAMNPLLEERGVRVVIGASEPHLLPMYMALGQRPYTTRNINSPEAGYLVPMASFRPDVTALRGVGRGTAPDELPACIRRLKAEPPQVRTEVLSQPTDYWHDIYRALDALHEEAIGAFDGFTEEEARRCISRSTVLTCTVGDRVMKRGGTARNMFVVLEGHLVALDEGRIVGTLQPGDVFGEMEFLLENTRWFDVDAVAENTRILCLSEGTMRKMIAEDAPVAAKLLANVSKMLCVRLIQAHARWNSAG
jgi:hypothetical protein